MPRKIARQRAYDIPFVGIDIRPITLGMRERAAVTAILPLPPSPEFLIAYGLMLGSYVAHRAAVASSTAAAVQNRLEAVADGATTLQKRLRQLNLTDQILYDGFTRERFWLGTENTTLNELSEMLARFLLDIKKKIALLEKEPKRGRMPALAEHALAKGLCQILFEETQAVPTLKAKGTFDRLLRLAFSQAKSGKPRKDVTDLMRRSLSDPPEDIYLLPLFRNNNEKRQLVSRPSREKID